MRSFAFLATLFLSTAATAQQPVVTPAEPYRLGTHYSAIEPAQPTATGDKVEILEIFSYACPACATFQSNADKLAASLPAGTAFSYVPAELQPRWEPFARAFFTAEALGVREKTHQPLFDAIFKERRTLRSLDELADFYAKAGGVDRAKFMDAATTADTEAKLTRATTLLTAYQVDGTPTVVVAGKYRVTGESAGGYPNVFDVVDFLVAKELAAKKS